MLPFLLPALIGAGASIAGSALSGGSGRRGSCADGSCGHAGHGGRGGGAGGGAQRFPMYNPQQNQALNRLLQQGLRGSGQLGAQAQLPKAPNLIDMQLEDQYGFDPIADLASNRFYGQTLPGLAERFTAMGGTGRSAGFQNLMRQQSGDFENQLAALRAQYGIAERQQTAQERQAQNELALRRYGLASQNSLSQRGQQLGGLQALLGYGLQPRFNTFFQPAAPPQLSAWSNLAGGLGQGLGQLGTLGTLYGLGLLK